MSNTKNNEYSRIVFRTECEVLEKTNRISNNENISLEELREEYEELSKQYQKLFSQARKIIRIGDTYEKKLLEVNDEIEEKNHVLNTKNLELIEAYKKIETIARTDPLTKLLNRRAMYEIIDDEIDRYERTGNPFSLILCDIDFFKKINDSYGHDCGDFVLVSISEVMLNFLRKVDKVARWGGEEFLFLLPETNIEGARKTIESLRKHIEEYSFNYRGKRVSVTLTFGICLYRANANINSCIEWVDKALYEGKEGGRNCIKVYTL
ncbi:MAG: GGDEF domain-containing protein [bacterium]|nr:GGDEF domain-containing protein [bacterium]